MAISNKFTENVATWAAGSSFNYPDTALIGTGTTTPSKSDTSLKTQIDTKSTTNSSDYLLNIFSFELASTDTSAVSGYTLTESGLSDDTVPTTLFQRSLVSGVVRGTTTQITVKKRVKLKFNLPIVNDGIFEFINELKDGSGDYPTHCAWGEGSTVPSKSDTAMESESERNALETTEKQSPTQVRFQGTLSKSEANGDTLTRVALFNAASGGDMFFHVPVGSISKNSDFSINSEFILIFDNPDVIL